MDDRTRHEKASLSGSTQSASSAASATDTEAALVASDTAHGARSAPLADKELSSSRATTTPTTTTATGAPMRTAPGAGATAAAATEQDAGAATTTSTQGALTSRDALPPHEQSQADGNCDTPAASTQRRGAWRQTTSRKRDAIASETSAWRRGAGSRDASESSAPQSRSKRARARTTLGAVEESSVPEDASAPTSVSSSSSSATAAAQSAAEADAKSEDAVTAVTGVSRGTDRGGTPDTDAQTRATTTTRPPATNVTYATHAADADAPRLAVADDNAGAAAVGGAGGRVQTTRAATIALPGTLDSDTDDHSGFDEAGTSAASHATRVRVAANQLVARAVHHAEPDASGDSAARGERTPAHTDPGDIDDAGTGGRTHQSGDDDNDGGDNDDDESQLHGNIGRVEAALFEMGRMVSALDGMLLASRQNSDTPGAPAPDAAWAVPRIGMTPYAPSVASPPSPSSSVTSATPGGTVAHRDANSADGAGVMPRAVQIAVMRKARACHAAAARLASTASRLGSGRVRRDTAFARDVCALHRGGVTLRSVVRGAAGAGGVRIWLHLFGDEWVQVFAHRAQPGERGRPDGDGGGGGGDDGDGGGDDGNGRGDGGGDGNGRGDGYDIVGRHQGVAPLDYKNDDGNGGGISDAASAPWRAAVFVPRARDDDVELRVCGHVVPRCSSRNRSNTARADGARGRRHREPTERDAFDVDAMSATSAPVVGAERILRVARVYAGERRRAAAYEALVRAAMAREAIGCGTPAAAWRVAHASWDGFTATLNADESGDAVGSAAATATASIAPLVEVRRVARQPTAMAAGAIAPAPRDTGVLAARRVAAVFDRLVVRHRAARDPLHTLCASAAHAARVTDVEHALRGVSAAFGAALSPQCDDPSTGAAHWRMRMPRTARRDEKNGTDAPVTSVVVREAVVYTRDATRKHVSLGVSTPLRHLFAYVSRAVAAFWLHRVRSRVHALAADERNDDDGGPANVTTMVDGSSIFVQRRLRARDATSDSRGRPIDHRAEAQSGSERNRRCAQPAAESMPRAVWRAMDDRVGVPAAEGTGPPGPSCVAVDIVRGEAASSGAGVDTTSASTATPATDRSDERRPTVASDDARTSRALATLPPEFEGAPGSTSPPATAYYVVVRADGRTVAREPAHAPHDVARAIANLGFTAGDG